MRRHLIWIAAAALSLSACSAKRFAVGTTAEILDDGIAAFEAEPDVELARESAGAQIKLLESLHRADPSNGRVLLALARTFGSYAFGFLELEAEKDRHARERAAGLYQRGADYGLKLLELRLGSGTEKLAREGSADDWKARLERAGKNDVPALFWTGYDWAGAIRKSVTSPAAVAMLPKAVALVERSLALDPSYYYGAGHLFMGVYYADRPKLLGGNPALALKHFDEAEKVSSGKYLMGRYLKARYYAVQAQNRTLFNELLRSIGEAPGDLLPEQRLSQNIARNWAQLTLKRASDYFVEE